MQLGKKISEVLQSVGWDFAKYQLLSMVFAGLWPFGLLRAASTLDSPFAIAKTRSDKAAKVLADALINHVQGNRPVTLVGYGLGARVMYSCLLQLADLNAFVLVESAVFMGAATPSDTASWRRIRAVVSGRVVNVFSANDLMLGFLYRTSSVQMGIAGVQPVEGIVGVENFDCNELVQGHGRYRLLVGTILQRIGFADINHEVVREQQDMLRQAEEDSKSGVRRDANTDRQAKDHVLAKEKDGRIILVDGKTSLNAEKSSITQHSNESTTRSLRPAVNEDEETDDESNHQIRMEDNEEPMSTLDPEPEPDYGPDKERVRSGSGSQGFDLEWDRR